MLIRLYITELVNICCLFSRSCFKFTLCIHINVAYNSRNQFYYFSTNIFQVGNTPLHLASQANEVDTVEVLIEKGADLNCLNQVILFGTLLF